ncbi:ClbS/DfsB family four-helix bundle protein [Christensenellaceae bacterium OttesenSCG-928-K19]|nr:ClbS/DfsB family four-helix bundle protein [Christensenellaceae bacterium OttesenSCG-928-K19]
MPRPTTKQALLTAANEQFEKMWTLIDSLPEDPTAVVFDFSGLDKKEAHWGRDKNLRDVLTHLYEWHQLLLSWVNANQSGEAKSFLPEPYNWKTYGQMNVGFWEKHQPTSYADAEAMLKTSHNDVLELIGQFSDEELFEKKHFPWTGNSSLGSYCVSATSSHYDWAIKKIKQYKKMCPADVK